MNNTQLIFVVGSGRCGTKMIKSLLAGTNIEARHEYMRNAYQREAVLYALDILPYHKMANKLEEIYTPAAYYSQSPVFLDSTHKLSWCVDVLADIYPDAKFVHLVRDGRKVATSFFYKLNIFDDYSAGVLRHWMNNQNLPMPPRDEKYWQQSFDHKDMFDRICWHWRDSNLSILDRAPYERTFTVKLEDLTASKDTMRDFLQFIGVEYDDSFHDAMQKQKHVYTPINYKLTDEQNATFARICGNLMAQLGYDMDKEAYDVNYQM